MTENELFMSFERNISKIEAVFQQADKNRTLESRFYLFYKMNWTCETRGTEKLNYI